MQLIDYFVKIPKTNTIIAVSIYVFFALAISLYGFCNTTIALLFQVLLPVAGLLFFTLIEYLTHRFIYHSGPDYKSDQYWQYKVHGVHHQYPNDLGLLALPIVLALCLGGIFLVFFYLLMGQHAFLFWPGFYIGYACYMTIHYFVHSRKPPKNFLKYLWRHHHLHHHVYEEKAFGVSSPLWDHLFGTMPPKGRIKRKKTNQNN